MNKTHDPHPLPVPCNGNNLKVETSPPDNAGAREKQPEAKPIFPARESRNKNN
jgi:hypothetical protein